MSIRLKPDFIKITSEGESSQEVIQIRQYEARIQPFPGEIILKNELCWAQYGPHVSDAAERLVSSNTDPIDQLWFESRTLEMPYFYHHSQRLYVEDLETLWTQLFPIGRGGGTAGEGVVYRHGHAVGKLGVNAERVHRAIRPHERPLK